MIWNDPALTTATNKLRFVIVYLLIIIGALLNGVSFFIPIDHVSIQIPFILTAIYYWCIYRPTILPVWLVFVMGIVLDILTMAPLGLNTLIMLVCRKVIVNQRRFLMSQPFLLIWLGFAIVNALTLITHFLVLFIAYGGRADIIGALIMWGAGILAFPFIYMLLHFSHTLLPRPDKQKSIKLHRLKKS